MMMPYRDRKSLRKQTKKAERRRRRRAMQDFIRIHEEDNVAVALRPIAAGEQLTVGEYQVTTRRFLRATSLP